MVSLIEKTQTAEAQSRSMLERVDRLKESAGSIRGIVDVLHQITSRTNILSLNAAIEAARAGAAGRSFAVVAEEIRKLADQSRQSLQTVGAMTESIEAEVEETVKALNEAYPIYREQIAAVNEADQIFRGVKEEMDGLDVRLEEVLRSTHTLEQSQRSLSEAMNSVSAVAEQSSAAAEEVASLGSEQLGVSDELVRLAGDLENMSNALKRSLSRFSA